MLSIFLLTIAGAPKFGVSHRSEESSRTTLVLLADAPEEYISPIRVINPYSLLTWLFVFLHLRSIGVMFKDTYCHRRRKSQSPSDHGIFWSPCPSIQGNRRGQEHRLCHIISLVDGHRNLVLEARSSDGDCRVLKIYMIALTSRASPVASLALHLTILSSPDGSEILLAGEGHDQKKSHEGYK